MMRPCILSIVALAALACHPPSKGLIGSQYPPLPPGWTQQSGSLIPDTTGGTDYSLAWMTSSSGDYLWFSKSLARDVNGAVAWQLLDTLRVPPLGPDRTLVIGNCTLAGKLDLELIAVVKTEPAAWWSSVVWAWRGDRRLGRFEQVPTTGMECRNEGYGV